MKKDLLSIKYIAKYIAKQKGAETHPLSKIDSKIGMET